MSAWPHTRPYSRPYPCQVLTIDSDGDVYVGLSEGGRVVLATKDVERVLEKDVDPDPHSHPQSHNEHMKHRDADDRRSSRDAARSDGARLDAAAPDAAASDRHVDPHHRVVSLASTEATSDASSPCLEVFEGWADGADAAAGGISKVFENVSLTTTPCLERASAPQGPMGPPTF